MSQVQWSGDIRVANRQFDEKGEDRGRRQYGASLVDFTNEYDNYVLAIWSPRVGVTRCGADGYRRRGARCGVSGGPLAMEVLSTQRAETS
jgi:hypothetical protein